MRIEEINGLINEVLKFLSPKEIEDMFIAMSKPFSYDGWRLFIRKRIVDDASLNCLKSIAKDCKLEIDDGAKKGYYVIYAPKKA